MSNCKCVGNVYMCVFTHVINEYVFQPKQKKAFAQEQSSIPGGLIGDTNMATIPLFRATNMATVMSRENTLQCSSYILPTMLNCI